MPTLICQEALLILAQPSDPDTDDEVQVIEPIVDEGRDEQGERPDASPNSSAHSDIEDELVKPVEGVDI